MSPDPQIFKATYSSVPVYEMICKGVAVMRRRSDSWLNATQILKVAGFDKPQRTRILERDVQKAEHEKVQGGYGKYQGTWVPLERGLAVAKQYHIETLLRPIIDFQPSIDSPPLAPKHITAVPIRAKRGDVEGSMMSTRGSRKRRSYVTGSADSRTASPRASVDGSMTSSPSHISSSSRTPSPIASSEYESTEDVQLGPSTRTKSRKRKVDALMNGEAAPERLSRVPDQVETDPTKYGAIILEYFVSDSNTIPPLLVSPPNNFDPNIALDDEEHTALHWACAIGRTRVAKLLITAGADIFKVNKQGQTALMRSVMFGNNYDVRKFSELYELLHRSTLNIDNSNRTVFHHVVDIATLKGKPHAARYYMETLFEGLKEFPQELSDIINFQDEDGETALTMAARCRSKRLVKLLIDHGADPRIRNRDGKTCEDYILEDERFRSSPTIRSRTLGSTSSYPAASNSLVYQTEIARRVDGKIVEEMSSILHDLAASFETELSEKESDLSHARSVLLNVQAEMSEAHQTISGIEDDEVKLEGAQGRLRELEQAMQEMLEGSFQGAWLRWLEEDQQEGSKNNTHSPIEAPIGGTDALNASDLAQIEEYYCAPIKESSDDVEAECRSLRAEIAGHRQGLPDTFSQLVQDLAAAGTGARMAEYRRLISAGCGGILVSDVDDVLQSLLEMLQADEPFTKPLNDIVDSRTSGV